MAIQDFGVTAAAISANHFPSLTFSTASQPTAVTVLEKIKDAAADLAGRLSIEGLSAATLDDDDENPTYPNAYRWCARYIRLHAAIGTLQASATADPEVLKAWREELREMRRSLDDYGHVALGDAPAPTTSGNGPYTHIDRHSLETSDSNDVSSVLPTFRKDDLL